MLIKQIANYYLRRPQSARYFTSTRKLAKLSFNSQNFFHQQNNLENNFLEEKIEHCHQVANRIMTDLGTKTKFTEGSIQDPNQGKIGGEFVKQQNPAFLDERLKYFDAIYAEQQQILAKAEKPEITVTLKDGKTIPGKAFETTPSHIAKSIFKKVPEKFVGAKIVYSKKYESELTKIGEYVDAEAEEIAEEGGDCCGGHGGQKFEVYDLERPLEGDCTLELIDFECQEGREVFWHSSAHMLGQALELNYGVHLCIGPPLANGFFYDSYMGNEKISQDNFAEIEKTFAKVASEKQPFQRVVLTKKQALELFKHNPFKVQLITNKIPDNAITTAYKCGKLIDLCTGPHLPHTGYVKAFKVEKNSAAYWLGKNTNDGLQRVYGIAFPSKKELDAHVQRQEELAKRDHRNIGKQQELFTFHQFSPGCAFFYPNGAHIYNKLMEVLRRQYKIRGYSEVITPNLFDAQLWKISGHWDKYKENMFLLKNDNEEHGFKPMNCPAHCLMFDSIQRSYRDLPLRYADFGVLHRNEVHGALSGLTRVRRFQQDDAHIFCTMDQIMEEIKNALDFIDYMYSLFGFKYSLALSTRPDNYIGEIEMWDQAENALKKGLEAFGKPWSIKAKDGAFYGPKIDIQLYDAFDRGHQCGTIQLDFNLPIRFNLQYRAPENKDDIEKQRKKQESTEESVPLSQEEKKKLEQQISEGESADSLSHKKSKKSTDSSAQSQASEKKYVVAPHHLKLGFQRPVILHRAVIGSFERFLAILCEQTAGKWPFWLSPKQLIICPITAKVNDFAQDVADRLKVEGYKVAVDLSESTIQKKVRNAQLEQYNYIAVVGEEEKRGGYVDLRARDTTKDQERMGKFTIHQLFALFQSQEPHRSQAEIKLMERIQHINGNPEHAALEEELKTKMFLEGEGFALGARDKEVYESLKSSHIDNVSYPNLHKWFQYLSKQA